MHFTRKISFNFEAELPKNFLINPPSTYTRVSNFGQNMDFKMALRLICGSTYTRVYRVTI
jgi:hypothetical protein